VTESATPAPRVTNKSVRGLPGRFTPNAWRALSAMQEEAQRFEHGYMGTEHLLLGLLRDMRSQASRAIINLGAEPIGLRTQLEGVIGRRGSLFTGGTGMTRRCQRVIEGSARLARQSGQRTVSTGLLLQSIVDSPEDVAGQLLESAGITADRISQELRHLGPEPE
jgi:ATP-dependent Clp protease ATP-binding subunit ClpC